MLMIGNHAVAAGANALSQSIFLRKLVGLSVMIVVGTASSLSELSWLSYLSGAIILGAAYSHALELVHQCIHETAFVNRHYNRLAGFLLGAPMLVVFSHYRFTHLQHHRHLGTDRDREFFNANSSRVSLGAAVRRLLIPARLLDFAKRVFGIVRGIHPESESKGQIRERIRDEYIALAGLLLTACIIFALGGGIGLFLQLWIIPVCLVAQPLNFLMELPEHFGCEPAKNAPRQSSRTIRTGQAMQWFTNGNNFHAEHHWYPTVPFDRLPALHELLKPELKYVTNGYREFFLKEYPKLIREV